MNQLYATFTTVRRSVPFSLRLQLAAWYTIAFAALLLLTGAVFYQYLEHSLEASVDTDLQLRATACRRSRAPQWNTHPP